MRSRARGHELGKMSNGSFFFFLIQRAQEEREAVIRKMFTVVAHILIRCSTGNNCQFSIRLLEPLHWEQQSNPQQSLFFVCCKNAFHHLLGEVGRLYSRRKFFLQSKLTDGFVVVAVFLCWFQFSFLRKFSRSPKHLLWMRMHEPPSSETKVIMNELCTFYSEHGWGNGSKFRSWLRTHSYSFRCIDSHSRSINKSSRSVQMNS